MPLRLVLGRLANLLGSVLIASLVVFAALNLLPGDVAQVTLGTNASPEAVDALRSQLGLDRSFWVRYGEWLGGFVTGQLGNSVQTGYSVAGQIAPKLAVTWWLVILGTVCSLLFALPVGIFAALHRRRLRGFVASSASQIGMAIPVFLAGIVLVLVFAVRLRWLPASGYVPLSGDAAQWFRHLILPVTSLGLVQGSMLTRYVRSAFIEVLNEDYLRTARAVGWTRRAAILRHGLRNASLSIITVLGLQLSTLFVGAIVVESVFVLPGLGSLLLNAVFGRDLVLVQGIVMLLVAIVLLINAAVDISYLLLDPRLRGRRSTSGGDE